LGTTRVPVSLRGASGDDALRCARYLSDALASGLTGKACAQLREGIPTTSLSSSEELTLEIGPTSSRWVRFVAIPERVDGRASGAAVGACLRPSPAVFEAGTTPKPVRGRLLGSVSPLPVDVDEVYRVALPEWEANGVPHRREGVVMFTPDRDGPYSVHIGTPNVGFQIRAEGASLPLSPFCSPLSEASGADPSFRETRGFRLKGGSR
jgi:hypothetical protein